MHPTNAAGAGSGTAGALAFRAAPRPTAPPTKSTTASASATPPAPTPSAASTAAADAHRPVDYDLSCARHDHHSSHYGTAQLALHADLHLHLLLYRHRQITK